MAPQQNSTFIDDDSKLRSKFPINQSTKVDADDEEEEEDEIIKRCSPILPPIDDDHDRFDEFEGLRSSHRQIQSKHNAAENTPKKYRQNIRKQIRSGTGNYKKPLPAQSCRSQRSRSISLHGANSTIDQGQTEITIWIDDEARYVSGVTKKTTCSDIVKALIDDELQNGNRAFFQRTKRDGGGNAVDVSARGDGSGSGNGHVDGVCATSRDYNDYVITESWRGIERGYDGNMTILPVWKAWSRVHNEFRLRLRHRRDIQDPIRSPKPVECQEICRVHEGQRQNLLEKFLNKLRRLWRKQKPPTASRSTSKHGEAKENCLPSKKSHVLDELKENCLLPKKAHIPDEFLFVILPDKRYEKEIGKDAELMGKKQADRNAEHTQLHRRRRQGSGRKTKASRKKQERGVRGVRDHSCIRRRQSTTTTTTALSGSSIQNTVRFRLARKTSEMDALYAKEYALTRELSEKCKLYRLQNQIYSNPDQQWNVSIGQVQRKIENYAREIVRTEHELLELKNEIKQDISLINNLKRMSLARDGDEPKPCPSPPSQDPAPRAVLQSHSTPNREMQFVDNIYEFCDNNASMLV